ncbi:MAG: bacteriohemerythrin [Fibromonadales bacterium]|nr:bacteriohemerythrin [Fibromonadales bacterium]
MPLKWTEQLSTKIHLFDHEHKKLVELINKLSDAMLKKEANNVLGSILNELTDYTIIHFKHEEDAMGKYNFPGLAAHKKQHEDFVSKVADTKKKYEEGAIMLTMPLIDFLTSWVVEHISKSDLAYSDFLVKAGMK